MPGGVFRPSLIVWGPSDFLQMGGWHNAPDSPESQLIGAAILQHPDKVARANPITYISRDDPPFCLIHGDRDDTVPDNQSRLLQQALARAKVPC